jgi:hypothetical protein
MRDENVGESNQSGPLSGRARWWRHHEKHPLLPSRIATDPQSRLVQFAFVVSAALIVLAPYIAGAQAPQRVYRVAHLSTAGRTSDGAPPRPLRDSLRELGYLEGQNLVYEARFAEGKVDRLPGLAAELAALKVDVIVAQGRPAVVAAKQATSTIQLSSPLPPATPWRPG